MSSEYHLCLSGFSLNLDGDVRKYRLEQERALDGVPNWMYLWIGVRAARSPLEKEQLDILCFPTPFGGGQVCQKVILPLPETGMKNGSTISRQPFRQARLPTCQFIANKYALSVSTGNSLAFRVGHEWYRRGDPRGGLVEAGESVGFIERAKA